MSDFRIVKVKRKDLRAVSKSAAWEGDISISSQFEWSAQGGESKNTDCFILVDNDTDIPIVFLGLTLYDEDFYTEVNFFVVVEFVYMHPTQRGRGASNNFIEWIADQSEKWIDKLLSSPEWSNKNYKLLSSSSAKSEEGSRFIEKLDRKLGKLAKKIN